MDIEDQKKRKMDVDNIPNLDVDSIIKNYHEAQVELLKLIAALSSKVVGLEKVFNKDLFQK